MNFYISDYLYMKENVEKVVNNILLASTHYEAFVIYKVILNATDASNVITIDSPDKYLDVDFLRTKFIELFNLLNEICKDKGLKF